MVGAAVFLGTFALAYLGLSLLDRLRRPRAYQVVYRFEYRPRGREPGRFSGFDPGELRFVGAEARPYPLDARCLDSEGGKVVWAYRDDSIRARLSGA